MKRDYQTKAEDCIFHEWESNRSTLLVLPTGTGKTVVMSGVIKRMLPKRTLVIAHREELIWQARDKIQRFANVSASVEMGQHRATMNKDLFMPTGDCIIATIQTLVAGGDGHGRMTKFNPDDFGLVIVDEAHHSTSSSYRKFLDYMTQNKDLKILGLTATPDRTDEEALGQIFDTVAYDYEIIDAIKDGWLVPVEQQLVSVADLDLRSVRTTAGDLNGADLAAAMEAEKPLHEIADSTLQIVGERKGIGFAASVHHAQMLAEIFNRHRRGISACVSAKTDKEERKVIIQDFAKGKIQFLWNCGVFTEGFDDAGVEVIAMARPTKSRSLYAQMAGRATRPHDSIASLINGHGSPMVRRGIIAKSCKPSCLILDFVGNSGTHKLITTADILGGNISDEVINAAYDFAKKAGKPVSMSQVLEDEEENLAERKKKEAESLARKAKLIGKATFKTQSVDPFDIFQIKPKPVRGWDKGKVLSDRQRETFRKHLSKTQTMSPC